MDAGRAELLQPTHGALTRTTFSGAVRQCGAPVSRLFVPPLWARGLFHFSSGEKRKINKTAFQSPPSDPPPSLSLSFSLSLVLTTHTRASYNRSKEEKLPTRTLLQTVPPSTTTTNKPPTLPKERKKGVRLVYPVTMATRPQIIVKFYSRERGLETPTLPPSPTVCVSPEMKRNPCQNRFLSLSRFSRSSRLSLSLFQKSFSIKDSSPKGTGPFFIKSPQRAH